MGVECGCDTHRVRAVAGLVRQRTGLSAFHKVRTFRLQHELLGAQRGDHSRRSVSKPVSQTTLPKSAEEVSQERAERGQPGASPEGVGVVSRCAGWRERPWPAHLPGAQQHCARLPSAATFSGRREAVGGSGVLWSVHPQTLTPAPPPRHPGPSRQGDPTGTAPLSAWPMPTVASPLCR